MNKFKKWGREFVAVPALKCPAAGHGMSCRNCAAHDKPLKGNAIAKCEEMPGCLAMHRRDHRDIVWKEVRPVKKGSKCLKKS